MYEHNGEEIFVIDSHVHLWDASRENVKHEGGEQFIQIGRASCRERVLRLV